VRIFGTPQDRAARKRARLANRRSPLQPTGFGEFRRSAFGVSLERISGGEMTVSEWEFRIGAE